MLVLLIRFLVISDKLLVVFIYIYFDILKDGLCLYSLWSYVGHSVCPLSLGPQRKLFVSSCSFIPRLNRCTNTAEVVGMRVGLIGKKRGLILVFTLCNRHNCVIKKKNRIFFPTHLCFASYYVLVLFCPGMFCDDYKILFGWQIMKNNIVLQPHGLKWTATCLDTLSIYWGWCVSAAV